MTLHATDRLSYVEIFTFPEYIKLFFSRTCAACISLSDEYIKLNLTMFRDMSLLICKQFEKLYSLLTHCSLCSESCRPMHEVTFATIDKPKLLSQVVTLLFPCSVEIL
jgi:hypothetical protein